MHKRWTSSNSNHWFHFSFHNTSGASWEPEQLLYDQTYHLCSHTWIHLCVANLWFSRRSCGLCDSPALPKTERHIVTLKSITLDFIPLHVPQKRAGSTQPRAPYNEVRTRPALTEKQDSNICSHLNPRRQREDERWRVVICITTARHK